MQLSAKDALVSKGQSVVNTGDFDFDFLKLNLWKGAVLRIRTSWYVHIFQHVEILALSSCVSLLPFSWSFAEFISYVVKGITVNI